MRTVSVAAAVVFHNNQCLITSRPDDKEFAGFWEFPGGKIEGNESVHQCLKRELEEELALQIVAYDILFVTEFQYEHKRVRLFFVRCAMPSGSWEIVPRERQQFRWVEFRELVQCQLLPADRAIAEFLAKAHGA